MRFFSLLLSFFLLFSAASLPALASTGELAPSAESAYLSILETDAVLYEKDADKIKKPASTTKIMTALVAAELAPPSTLITVTREAVGIEGSSVYLKEGEIYSLESLLHALLLQSANDAAAAIAIGISGSVEAFVQEMNQKAQELSLSSTHFMNPHGLDHEEHYTTARELAAIAAAALKNETVSKILSTKTYRFFDINGENPRTLVNHNKMLFRYDGAIGVKTGFTKKSGRCLVSAAEREGLTIIAVTLGDPCDWQDHETMLNHGFSCYENRILAEPGALTLSIPLLNGGTAVIRNRDPITASLPKGAPAPAIFFEIFPRPASPKQEGDIAGCAKYLLQNKEFSFEMIYSEDIS